MPDLNTCPICKRPNKCEHHRGGEHKDDCWCHHIILSKDVFDEIKKMNLGLVCICKECLKKLGAKEIG